MTGGRLRPLLLLAVLWLLVQAALWGYYGTMTELEAKKYIHAARYLLGHGNFPERKYLFYADTPLLIAASLKLGLGYAGAIVFQLALNGLSTAAFYQLVSRATGSARAAFAGTAALLLFIPYQSWNVYLYTESVFFSALVLFMYCLYRLAAATQHKARWCLLSAVALLLLVTARPFGMLFLPAVLLFGFFELPRRLRAVSGALALLGLGFLYIALNRAFSGSVDWNALRPNVAGSIICDIPDPRYQQPLHLRPGGNPVDQLAYYIVHNPAHYARLSVLRLKAFLLPTRTWYSGLHNAFLVGVCLLLYTTFALGIGPLRRRVPRSFFAFLVLALAGYTIAITFQCDDYHNRFWLALAPMLILAAAGVFVRRQPLHPKSLN
ncbi:MAG: hypothetical protein EOO16_17845 [Chitinophagaceae bacterium]|nr:MAG: hypothetical protein EOO16_17845 [Chitinophagaceae bacterium]